MVNWS